MLAQVYVSGPPPAVPVQGAGRKLVTPASAFWATKAYRRFFYDDEGHLLGEYDSATGYSQETVWFNGQPVATMIGGVLYYINADNLGTPRSIVRPTDGVEVWRWDSDPFGGSIPTGTTITSSNTDGSFAGVAWTPGLSTTSVTASVTTGTTTIQPVEFTSPVNSVFFHGFYKMMNPTPGQTCQ